MKVFQFKLLNLPFKLRESFLLKTCMSDKSKSTGSVADDEQLPKSSVTGKRIHMI